METVRVSAAGVMATHRLVGATKFSHRKGLAYVEYPKCGCGERMGHRDHPQHVLDALAQAGYRLSYEGDS